MGTVRQNKKDLISCTTILYIMVISGFAINYMMRVNISIALVDMIETNSTSQNSNVTRTNSTKFNWTVIQKNEILGSFFWGYMASVFIGGRLAENFGTKKIFGYSTLAGAILTVLMPLVCRIHFYAALVLRLFVGVFLGVAFPAILPIAINWIPPLDRSKFTSNMMAQGLGVAVTLPACGFLISYLGWESVFYVTGGIALLWSLLWFYLIYDFPGEHPRISTREKEKIEIKMVESRSSAKTKPSKVPWKSLLTSLPVWSIMVAQSGNGFYHFTFVNQLPTYMNDVLKYNIETNGVLSCLPFIGQYAFACIGCYLADKMQKSGKFSTKNTRKIFVSIAFFIPSILMIILALWKTNPIIAVVILTLIHSFKGCISAGYVANSMDISPNYSATILGISLMIGSTNAWIGTKMVGLITKHHSNFETWGYIFIAIALLSGVSGLFFVCFADGKVQPWNNIQRKEAIDEKEMEPLQKDLVAQ